MARTSKRRRRNETRFEDEGEYAGRIVQAEYQGKHFKATVLKMDQNPTMYYVHYEGWNQRYDQWLSEDKVVMDKKSDDVKSTPVKVETPVSANGANFKKTKVEAKPEPKHSSMSSYEQKRLENIRRNQAMLASLNVANIKYSLTGHNKKKIVKAKGQKKSLQKRTPTRRSLRQQGRNSTGEMIPDDFKALPKNAYKPDRLWPEGTMEITSSNKDFLKQLLSDSDVSTKSETVADVDTLEYAKRLSEFEVDDDQGVRKLVKSRIYCVDVHPDSRRVMCAAGGKTGDLGFWRVGSTEGNDGVVTFQPHSTVVSGIMFDKTDPNKLFSSSYDGRIRVLDLQQQSFSEACFCDDSLYGMDSKSGSNIIYAASKNGIVRRIDPRAKKIIDEWELHGNKIFTVRLNQADPNMFCTASLDRTMAIWDVRKIKKKPVYQMVHGLCVSGASYSPDGKYIVSCCNDNKLRVWLNSDLCKNAKCENGPPPSSIIRKNNHTGRWLTKLKCEWDPKQSNSFVVGSMERPRCIEVYSADSKGVAKLSMRLRDENVNSVCSVNRFHPTLDVIVAANSSGKVHIWKSL